MPQEHEGGMISVFDPDHTFQEKGNWNHDVELDWSTGEVGQQRYKKDEYEHKQIKVEDVFDCWLVHFLVMFWVLYSLHFL